MEPPRTFTELALRRTFELGGREAYLFVTADRDGRLVHDSVSYAELGLTARRLASRLQQRGASGGRVLILQGNGRLFITSFLACLFAGAVPVPAPPPIGSRHSVERVANIVRDAAVCCVLTDAASASAVSHLLANIGHIEVDCLATDRMRLDSDADWVPPAAGPDDIAFLQYTSGSVSEPKGVMVSHRGLLANELTIHRATDSTPDSRVGGWLPFHHDMGLVGHLLQPLWLGGTGVLMPPMTFVKRPLRWLQMIDRYGITIGGGPNLAYDLCVRRVKDEEIGALDLSRWRVAVNGAEPVRAETMEAFSRRFAPAGFRAESFYPCYGLAEATLLVSGGTPDRRAEQRVVDAAALEQHRIRPAAAGHRPRTLTSSGRPLGCTVRIVDPDTRGPLSDGEVGEVWVRGESVSGGYWNRPLENAHAFRAETTDGDGGYLRTGDLGSMSDGELFITGRLKDIMFVAGRNLYPQDIERSLQRVSALLGTSAAFAVEGDRDHVVVVQEVRASREHPAEFASLSAGVQQCIAREFEVAVENVLLVRPGTVRRTTSGKLRRVTMRELFLRGELQPLHEVMSPELRELVGGVRRAVQS
ncbi:4-hydroxyphenylalkanoate adenylyltransferase [Streptomyces sp. RB5]|uniref:4-hydroxyphenylalkanoate adenylyltransferase n=1 Tax=Streptomyces smaragdinus TaxID=2585196 RepID=A0A7K0CDW7_9ACTN|nr:fatty acyl-AMP ligase [Streptomyces smaragdinus]MQY11668.1 4-hydroxyphenylalkanoate adenylyltransferase [Streptomyces smaragdinus]